MELDMKEIERANGGIKENMRQLEERFTEDKKVKNNEERKVQKKILQMEEVL
jgi:hypothetical protein